MCCSVFVHILFSVGLLPEQTANVRVFSSTRKKSFRQIIFLVFSIRLTLAPCRCIWQNCGEHQKRNEKSERKNKKCESKSIGRQTKLRTPAGQTKGERERVENTYIIKKREIMPPLKSNINVRNTEKQQMIEIEFIFRQCHYNTGCCILRAAMHW